MQENLKKTQKQRLANQSNNRPPRSLTTVTPLSKTLALLLFITLPFIGFILGIHYQKITTPQTPNSEYSKLNRTSNISPSNPPKPTSTKKENLHFPKTSFSGPEGTVRIEYPQRNYENSNHNFILVLTLDSENILNQNKTHWITGKEYSYPIELEATADSIREPLIARNHKYGCVTLQASGYVGAYVFKIDSGKGIFKGPQYSKCIDWIDQERVIIYENLYNTQVATYYILNANTNTKTELSNFQLNKL